ncbi:NADPH:quinone oxidoreductase family protein [Jatrophihabitans fulvus]
MADGTMKAWQVTRLGEPERALALCDLPVPQPGPGQVLLRVRTASLGFPDVLFCQGRYQVKPDLPFVLGSEVCGDVVDGDLSEVPGVALGGRVAANPRSGTGALAQFALADARHCHPVPDELSDAEAAAVLTGSTTAWFGLVERARLQRGEVLVVTAPAGGVGSAAVQLGRALGATVVAVVRGPAKTATVHRLGAHHVVDASDGSVVERVKELTDGRGADVVFDPVGGAAFDQAQRYMAFGGRYLVVGFAGGDIQTARLNRPLLGSWSIVGVNVGLHVAREPERVRRAMDEIGALCRQGLLTPLVGAQVSMAEAPQGLRAIANGTSVGRVVVDVWS